MTARMNIAGTFPAAIATYTLTNKVTGHFYIGSTNNLARRLNRHRCDLERGVHHAAKLQRQFYGWEHINVDYDIHDDCEFAMEYEQWMLDERYHEDLCCNMATSTDGFWGGIHGKPQEVRDRAASKLRGYRHTDEFKEKCRQRMLGTTMSANQKEKISNALIGRTLSEETKRRVGLANKGKRLGVKVGPEPARKAHATKIANGTLGHTEESKAKIAEANFKPVIIEGVRYVSVLAASEALGYGRATVTYRINSPTHKFRNWNWA